MNHRPRFFATLTAAALLGVGFTAGGCAHQTAQRATVDQPLSEYLELAMNSPQPTFGVGDELGWLAFGDLAIAPLPGEPTDVLVVARAEPVDEQSFDWMGRYLALAD